MASPLAIGGATMRAMPLDLSDAELATAANCLPRDGVPRGEAGEEDGEPDNARGD